MLGIVLALMVGACDESLTAPSVSDLTGRWQLVSLHPRNSAVIHPRARTTPGIEFIADRVSVESDCNLCSGRYTLSGTTFRLSPLACTRRACVEGSIEGPYLQILSSVSSAAVLPGRALRLDGPDGAAVFTP